MRIFKMFSAKTAALALAASMVFQGTALAAPLDELNEILENQAELQGDSLMEQTLGLSDLGDAIGDDGLNFHLKVQLDEATAALLSEEAGPLADGAFSFGLQVDEELEKWLVGLGLGTEAEPLLEASLYGDAQQLALSLPQFYTGALALGAGNLKEQLANSDLAVILGMAEEDLQQMPDINMTFWPSDALLDAAGNTMELQADLAESLADNLEANAQVEKTEVYGGTVYSITVQMDDVIELYRAFYTSFFSVFTDSTLSALFGVNTSGMDTEELVDQMLGQLDAGVEDTFTMDYEVQDNLVRKIRFEMNIDTNAIEQAANSATESSASDVALTAEDAGTTADIEIVADDAYPEEIGVVAGEDAEVMETEIVEETLAPVGNAEDAAPATDVTVNESEADASIVTVDCEVAYFDPAQPQNGFSISIDMTEEATGETIAMLMDFGTETEGTKETSWFGIEVMEDGTVLYAGTPYTATFDAATGDLDVLFSVEADDEAVALILDSTFTEIEKGRGFVLTIDELSMSVDGEKLGLSSEIGVSADPGSIDAPTDSRMVLELTQGGLLDLVNEISANAETWAAQFVPQTEAEVLQ